MSRVFVTGIGAVSPAGWGVAPLQAGLQSRTPLPVQNLERPGWNTPLKARLVPPPTNRPGWLSHARLRRASPITHYSVAAALEALADDAALVTQGKLKLGIVICTMTGGISYSRRFYQEALQNPATASPMIFPETVFNAPSSHLAALLGSSEVNNTMVGDAGTFLQGLVTAAGWLDDRLVEACLVIGAEEPDWTAGDALRLFDDQAIYAAGAGALYLKNKSAAPPAVELVKVSDAIAATRNPGRDQATRKVRHELGCAAANELLCASEPKARAWMEWPGDMLTPATILGEAFVASTAWQCVAAADSIRSGSRPGATVAVSGPGCQTIGARFVATDSNVNTNYEHHP